MCQSALGEDTFNGVLVERQQKVFERDSFSSGISGNTIFVVFFFFFLRQCVCVLKLQTLSTSSPFMLGGRWAWFLPIMNSDWGKITVIQCLQNSFTHQQSDKHPHPPRVNKKKILSVTWCSTLVFRCASEVQRVKVKRRIQWNMHKPVNNINTLTLETLPQQHEAGHTLSARAYLKKRNTEVW